MVDKKTIFRVAIIGSRDFNDYDFLKSKVLEVLPKNIKNIIILSGGAKGTDALGEKFAKEFNYPLEVYRAKWWLHGKCAGYLRNNTIVKNADMVIAFWNGLGKGVKHTINIAQRHTDLIYIIRIDDLIKKERDL